MRISARLLLVAGLVMAGSASAQAQSQPWMIKSLPATTRAELLVAAMTTQEKIQQIAMSTGPNPDIPSCGPRRDSRHVEGIPRLGIPVFRSINGPTGVGGGDCSPDGKATAVPTGLAVAATWDPTAAYRWGDIAGSEVRANGHHAFYAPGVNLARVPEAGRNFEYFGEDPYLAGRLAAAQTLAIQSHGVHAVGKHFVANEQETQRMTMNSVVADRVLHELYLLPFEMMIRDADMASVMCSYPRVNGAFACESPVLLGNILRKEFGFKGYVVSDRGATNSTVAAIKAGMDLELNSTPKHFTQELVSRALESGEIVVEDLDRMLVHRYASMFRFGQFDNPIVGVTPIDFPKHGQIARTIAEEGAVLLKNDSGLLPLNAQSVRTIAVIGSQSLAGEARLPATGPEGQIRVNAPYTVAPVAGLKNVLAALGSQAAVSFNDGTDLKQAVELARSSDVVIVMVGDQSIEGVDRADLALHERNKVDQNALVTALADANPRTVVVLKNSGAVLMPWLDRVHAVLAVWQPGQEDGTAVANLVMGVVNPSGKLPVTFPNSSREGGGSATPEQWPGVVVNGILTARYTEGLQMGYRWYQAQGKKPVFPFGFGLSYTSFEYAPAVATSARVTQGQPITISVGVRNSGDRAGAEVVQIYAGFPDAYGEPPKRLIGFEKVFLNPGERRDARITLDPSASNHPFSYWNEKASRWDLMTGKVLIYVSRSSSDVQSTIEMDAR